MTKSVYQKKKSRLIKKLDSRFSKLVRLRDGKCKKCGAFKNLQCSHIISRGKSEYRWNFKNAKTLCVKCHLYWWHRDTFSAPLWLEETLPLYFHWAKDHRNKQNYLYKENLSTLQVIEEELNKVTIDEIKDTFNPEHSKKYTFIF